ncbi:MAG: contractile injection system tape measure protein, partial [Spirulina sp.]
MSNSPHRIRRLRYVVSTNSQEEAFAIRKSLRDRWSEELLSAIEGVFDEAVGSDRLLHLSKLEINLKVSSEGELMEVLPELIRQQLEEQLRWMKGETVPTTQAGAIEGEAIVPSNPFDSLLYYLQAGSLPWEVAYRRPSDIAVYLKETCRQQWPELRDRLRRQRETAPFYFRLLQFLPPEEVPDLVNAASEQIPQVWRTALVQLLTLVLAAKPEVFPQHPRWRLAAAIWSKSWPTRERSIVADLTALADSVLSSEEKEQFGELIASLPPLAAAILQPTTRRDSVPDRPLSASQAERDPGSALSEKERTSRRESDRDFPDLPSSPPMSKRQAGGESSS